MQKVYYSPSNPGSFGGVDRLRRQVKNTKKEIQEWLTGESPYTLHKPIKKNFRRIQTLAFTIGDQFQIDLVDMSSLSRYNNGYRYILTCIDVFSRFAWAIPVKSKRGIDIKGALVKIFNESNPLKVQSDQGTEFLNRTVQTFFKEKGITFFFTRSVKKASVVERFNRTLKSRMWRYFTRSNTYRYVDVLADLVSSYNSNTHHSTGFAPKNITKENEHLVWLKHRKKKKEKNIPKFKIGDKVRIVKLKQTFDKGYEQGWSLEIFTIREIIYSDPITYRLEDFNSEIIEGRFYEPELQKVKEPEFYIIEKILKKRGGRVLVKWKGYPDSMNSWIKESSLRLL